MIWYNYLPEQSHNSIPKYQTCASDRKVCDTAVPECSVVQVIYYAGKK